MTDLSIINELKQQISDLYDESKKQIDSKLKVINNEIKQIKVYHDNFYKKSIDIISKIESDINPLSTSKYGLTTSELSPMPTNNLLISSKKSKTPPKNKINNNLTNKKNTNEYFNELTKASQNDLRHALLNHQKKKNILQFKNPHESSSSHEFVLKKKKSKNNQNMGTINTKDKKNNLNINTSSIYNYSSQHKRKLDNKINPPISISTEVINISSTLKKKNIINKFVNERQFDLNKEDEITNNINNNLNNNNENNEFITIENSNNKENGNVNENYNYNFNINNNEEFDLRKFSIIDIPSYNQIQERKNEIVSSPLKVDEHKNNFLKEILKEEIKEIQDPKELCIYLCTKSNVVPFKTRIKLSKIVKNIYKLNSPSEILEDYIIFLESVVKKIKAKLKIKFSPSFTARSEINFINAKDENEFYNFNTDDKDILSFLKCLLIIFNFNKDLNNYKCKELIKEIKNASNGKIRNFLLNEQRLKCINELSLEKIDRFTDIFYEIKDEIKNKKMPTLLYKINFLLQEIYPFLIDRSKNKKKFLISSNELNKLKQNQFLSKIE